MAKEYESCYRRLIAATPELNAEAFIASKLSERLAADLAKAKEASSKLVPGVQRKAMRVAPKVDDIFGF